MDSTLKDITVSAPALSVYEKRKKTLSSFPEPLSSLESVPERDRQTHTARYSIHPAHRWILNLAWSLSLPSLSPFHFIINLTFSKGFSGVQSALVYYGPLCGVTEKRRKKEREILVSG